MTEATLFVRRIGWTMLAWASLAFGQGVADPAMRTAPKTGGPAPTAPATPPAADAPASPEAASGAVDPRNPQLRYRIVSLGHIFTLSATAGLNQRGQVAGTTLENGYQRAVLWDERTGPVRLAGPAEGSIRSASVDLNNGGQVAGDTLTMPAGRLRAFLWRPNQGLELLEPLPGDLDSAASALNDNGEVVGYSYGPNGPSLVSWRRAAEPRVLHGAGGYARAVNNAGLVVGGAGVRAAAWDPRTGAIDIGLLPDTDTSVANAVNAAGTVVGNSERYRTAPRLAFVWTPREGLVQLPTLPGGLPYSSAWGIDDRERIYGASGGRAVVWLDRQPVDLNERVDPSDPLLQQGLVLLTAVEGNARGEIVAYAAFPGTPWFPVLLRPR